MPIEQAELPSFDFWTFVEEYIGDSQETDSEFKREYDLDADPLDIPCLYRSRHSKDDDFYSMLDSRELNSLILGVPKHTLAPYYSTPCGLLHFVMVDFDKELHLYKVVFDNEDSEGKEVPVYHYYIQYKYDNTIRLMFPQAFPKSESKKAPTSSKEGAVPATTQSSTAAKTGMHPGS